MRKMLISAISCINCLCRRQQPVKGLKIGDYYNKINAAISTGVVDRLSIEQLHNAPNSYVSINATYYEIAIHDSE